MLPDRSSTTDDARLRDGVRGDRDDEILAGLNQRL
jgi:hypothetical protein